MLYSNPPLDSYAHSFLLFIKYHCDGISECTRLEMNHGMFESELVRVRR